MSDEARVAVVTGGGSGIGAALALRFASRGVAVVVADRDVAAASDIAAQGTERGGRCHAVEVDVAVAESVARFADVVSTGFGPPHVLVNNAGWNRNQPFLDSGSELWDPIVQINLLGVIRVTHALVPGMVDRDGALRNVVNVASDAGRVGSSGDAVYSAAKGGVIAFTKTLAREVAGRGVVVNCVCPGPTDTPLFRGEQSERMQAALLRTVPLRRLGRAEEVAAVVELLASSDASFVTGQVISVNGGATMVG